MGSWTALCTTRFDDLQGSRLLCLRQMAAALACRALMMAVLSLNWAHGDVTNFGYMVNFTHSASYSPPTNPWIEQESKVLVELGKKEFNHSKDFRPFGDWGDVDSGFSFSISPGYLWIYWSALTNVESGVGNPQATIDCRARLNLALIWNETFSVDHDTSPDGSDVQIVVSHGLTYSLDGKHPNQDAFNFDVQTRFSTPEGDWQIDGGDAFPRTEPIDPQGKYEAGILNVKVGDVVTLSMSIRAVGQTYCELINGQPPIGGGTFNAVEFDCTRSHRIGIRALTPGTQIVSASGHVYPGHAMSPAAVQSGLAGLHIKSGVYNPATGRIGFAFDAIPGASYVLQKSTDLQNWTSVTAPRMPENFQEIILEDSLSDEERAFWRIEAVPQ